LKGRRCYYLSSAEPPFFREELASFQFLGGRESWVHSKNSETLSAEIQRLEPKGRILEVSTASSNPIGVKLSALNLILESSWGRHSVERVFQASKVFEFGGPFPEILNLKAGLKTHIKSASSGKLIGFRGPDGLELPADGTSNSYDRLYISALTQNSHVLEQLLGFDIFTDLRFAKTVKGFSATQPVNTQARSCAIARSLFAAGGLNRMRDYASDRVSQKTSLDTSLPLFDD